MLSDQPPPEVTFFLFAYNQQNVVERAIQAAFDQEYEGRLEIILSDDCSADDTFGVMQRMAANYDGPHDIVLNRNAQNLGLIGHVNRAFELSNGPIIVPAAGDDISTPDRVRLTADAFAKTGALLTYCDMQRIDTGDTRVGEVLSFAGRIQRQTARIRKFAHSSRSVNGACCAWHADLYEQFGPITQNDTYEDLVLPFRAMIEQRIAHIPDVLVLYRTGGMSDLSRQSSDELLAYRQKRWNVQINALRQRRDDLNRATLFRPRIARTLDAVIESMITATEAPDTAALDAL